MRLSAVSLIAVDAVLYLVLTLGFAIIWDLQVFTAHYTALGWPSPEEADVPLGFLAIVTQAMILAWLFSQIAGKAPLGRSIVIFCSLAFAFLWSSHVVGDAAKCGFVPKSTFIAIESLYLVLQFVLYGSALALVHGLFDPRWDVVR